MLKYFFSINSFYLFLFSHLLIVINLSFMLPLQALLLLSSALISAQLSELIEVSKPNPLQDPFEPPFRGGQCLGNYVVFVRTVNSVNGQVFEGQFSIAGKITSVVAAPYTAINRPDLWAIEGRSSSNNSVIRIAVSGSAGIRDFGGGNFSSLSLSINVQRSDGGIDNCGDLPNPNPEYPIPDSGTGKPPINDLYDPELLYAPIVVSGGAVALAQAALTAAAAALTAAIAALSTATTLADLIQRLVDLFNRQEEKRERERELEDEKEKERKREDDKKRKKEIWRQRIGDIVGDGMLSVIPKDTSATVRPLYLEINYTSIPVAIGKYFGVSSPNRYPYGFGLGYIALYGYGAGIRSLHQLEFRRNSIAIPDGTLGFVYHLGLNSQLRATVDLVYEREVQG